MFVYIWVINYLIKLGIKKLIILPNLILWSFLRFLDYVVFTRISHKIEGQEMDLNDLSINYLKTNSYITLKIDNKTLTVPSIVYRYKNYVYGCEIVPIPLQKNKFLLIIKT